MDPTRAQMAPVLDQYVLYMGPMNVNVTKMGMSYAMCAVTTVRWANKMFPLH